MPTKKLLGGGCTLLPLTLLLLLNEAHAWRAVENLDSGERAAGPLINEAGENEESHLYYHHHHHHSEPKPKPKPLPKPKPKPKPINNDTLRAFRAWGFGMVSYYDTFTNPRGQNALLMFIKKYNISVINQYVCANTNSSFFAEFVNRVHNKTGAHINVLFDDTLVAHSTGSTCDIPCVKGQSIPIGYCCGSVARKFAWLADVIERLEDRAAINGAAFDIEGLREIDYLRLFETMRFHWNETIIKRGGDHQILRWYFGSGLGDLAALAVGRGLIDQILWENYQNWDDGYAERALRVLQPLTDVLANATSRVSVGGPPVALLSETNCCQTPCVDGNKCGMCGTVSLPAREEISFCASNKDRDDKSRHMNVNYMLSTFEKGIDQLWLRGYGDLIYTPILYDYRALHILLEGTDAEGTGMCPKSDVGSYAAEVADSRAGGAILKPSFFGTRVSGNGFNLLQP